MDDAPRTGCPKASKDVRDLIVSTIIENSTTRIWSCQKITFEVSKHLASHPFQL